MTTTPQNLLATGLGWLAGQLKANASSPITYARGSDSATIYAQPGQTQWDVEAPTGQVIQEVTRDYIVLVADLVLPVAGQTQPARGDFITETINGLSCTFEVVAPSDAVPWKWGDGFRNTYRIHTKKVAA